MSAPKLQIPQPSNFNFESLHKRVVELRNTTRYNEFSRDFLDHLANVETNLRYLMTYSFLLDMILSGKGGREFEQKLREASDYLQNLRYDPKVHFDLEKEERLVQVENNLAEIVNEIDLIVSSKNRPLEPKDIFGFWTTYQGLKPLHCTYDEYWNNATPEQKKYAEDIANKLRSLWGQSIPTATQKTPQKGFGQQQGQMLGQPMGQQMGQPQMGQQMGQPPMGQQMGQPTGQQMGQPIGQQMGQQMGQPMGQQMGQPMQQQMGQMPPGTFAMSINEVVVEKIIAPGTGTQMPGQPGFTQQPPI
jgi:hypothetical protein